MLMAAAAKRGAGGISIANLQQTGGQHEVLCRSLASLVVERERLDAAIVPGQLPDPPAAVYLYSPHRRAERPAAHLQHFKVIIQVDGYPGFERLPAAGYIQLAAAGLTHAASSTRCIRPRAHPSRPKR
jgi:hypothetical protein